MLMMLSQIRLEELSQTYFTQFVVAGGPIVWFILLPMSVGAISLLADLMMTIRRGKLLPVGISSDIATVAAYHGAASILGRFGKNKDLISKTICTVYAKTRKMHPTQSLLSQIAAETLQEQGLRLLRRAEWCNLLGTVAPMVGLFGTVWGMIEAFNLLGVSAGQPRPGELASAISVALVTTFWGLLIAIPSLFVYGMFRSRIEGIVAEAAVEVETLLERVWELGRQDMQNKSAVEKNTSPQTKEVVSQNQKDIEMAAGFVDGQKNNPDSGKAQPSQVKK